MTDMTDRTIVYASTSTATAPTPEPRPSMDDYPIIRYEFKKESYAPPVLNKKIVRSNPPTKNIIRKKEIKTIQSLSDTMYYFHEAIGIIEGRRIPSDMIQEIFESIVAIGNRIIELTPILDNTKLMVYLFEHESELAINLESNIKLFEYNINRKLNWSYHPREMELYLYGISTICRTATEIFKRYFDKYEIKSNIKAIKAAYKACTVFMDSTNPDSLEDVQNLIVESNELEANVQHLFKTFAGHSQGEKALKVVQEMQRARNDSFNYYSNSKYADEIKNYVLESLMYTGMKFKSLTRGGSRYPWVIQFTWPRDPDNKNEVYTIEMSNSTKDFHFPFCVDHQNHTLIDAILVHLTQAGMNQDAVVL